MALSAKEIKALALWAHQSQGVRVIQDYLARARPKAAAAALVNVPTGGGKSAIIGAAIHGPAFAGLSLVLTPRKSLRKQLFQDLEGSRGLLSKVSKPKLRVVKEAKSVRELISHLGHADAIVATIQLIQKATKSITVVRQLHTAVRAVFVDEGHYEPAASWSNAIRSIDRPTILLTATPYRNDFRGFELDGSAIHVTRYEDLRKARILRELKVIAAPFTEDPDEFVSSALQTFQRETGSLPTLDKRLIIRCASKANIEAIQHALANYPGGPILSLGVHEEFSTPIGGVDTDPPTYRHPPEPSIRVEPVWVHQWKLLEGIDSPSFRAVATFQPFGSARALVQQIGRVLRNPSGTRSGKALLIDFTGGQQTRQWQRYLAFDLELTATSLREGIKEFSATFDKAQPQTIYMDGEFRSRLLIAGATRREIEQSLRLPFRCSVLKSYKVDPIDKLKDLTIQRFRDAEYNFQFFDVDDDMMLALFVSTGTSPYLSEHYYVERSLHVIAALRVGKKIVVTDTSRTGVTYDVLTEIGRPISRRELNRVLDLSAATVFTDVSSRSMIIGGSGIRGRTTHATSLEGAAPLLDDFMFAPTSIAAINRTAAAGSRRRELGFSTARITDGSSLGSLLQWKAWARELIDRSEKSTRAQPIYLDRYAFPLEEPPADPEPRSVLFNLATIRSQFEYRDPATGVASPVDIEDSCFELLVRRFGGVPTRVFPPSAKVNGVALKGTVTFDTNRHRYEISSDELSRYISINGGSRVSLLDYLNSSQEFYVIPKTSSVVYCEGTFFDPKLKLGTAFDATAIGLDGVFEVFPALQHIRSEKGGVGSATLTGWSANSVFEWIDLNVAHMVPNPQLVICDDGNREACDFVLVGEDAGQQVVVMVHAKASKTRNVAGASKLQEVCGQAVKQVGMFNSFSSQRPPQTSMWQGPWDGPSGEGTVANRIRLANGAWAGLNGDQIWDKLSVVLRNQGTRREVALVLGATLNKAGLYQAAARRVPRPHAAHAIHLLRSTISSVSAAGGRLRILCD